MVSYQSGSKSTSSQGTLPLLSWPEARGEATRFKNYILPNVYGDTTRGLAAQKGKIVERGAESSITGSLRTLASSKMSPVAKQKGALSLMEKGAEEGAKARVSGLDEAMEYFKWLLGGQIGSFGESKTSSGGGGGIGCWVWTYFDGRMGENTQLMRKYRNERFGKESEVDHGYHLMGEIILPLMKHPLIRWLTFHSVYLPLTNLARGKKTIFNLFLAYFWETVFKRVAKLDGKLTLKSSHQVT